MLHRILRLTELTRVTGLRRSALYAKIAEGAFPKPIPLGERAVGWLESDVDAWQQQRIALRDQRQVTGQASSKSGKSEKNFTAPRTPLCP